MKKYQKLFSRVMIVALCVSGMALGACKRSKKHRTEVTTGAAVNAMMMTNPLGSLFGKKSFDEGSGAPQRAPADVSGVGCPAIDIGLSVSFPQGFSGSIDLAYNNSCIVHGLEMSGEVKSQWSIILPNLSHGLELDSTVEFDNLTMEGRHTDGSLHQLLYAQDFIPYLAIDGTLTITHADGKTRIMEFDTLTATVDLGNYTQFKTIFPGVTITDDNTAALVINGNAQYTDEDGMLSAMTFDNVKQPFGCVMPASGTVHLVNDAKNYDAMIDYGDGTCDTLITVTLKGQDPQEIDVAEWMKTH